MNVIKVGKICGDQDGAIWNDYLFRFKATGDYAVYDLKNMDLYNYNGEQTPIYKFKLDRFSEIVPHSNAVVFTNEYYYENDEFPLLLSNVYNNYMDDDTLNAVALAYRVQRDGEIFLTKLVGMIEIDFKNEESLWCSKNGKDARPYGNFLVDTEKDLYYAFVMIDDEHITRYFTFEMPKIAAGSIDEKYGIRKIVLKKENIKEKFDTEYHNFIQGGVVYKSLIYSTEGFTESNEHIPAIRIIDPNTKKQIKYIKLPDYNIYEEPEFIDFYKGVCLYSDEPGNLYTIELNGDFL